MRAKWCIVIVFGLLLAACSSAPSASTSSSSPAPGPSPHALFTVRPVLCTAPGATAAAPGQQAAGSLPACAAASQMSAENLAVTPNPSDLNGYSMKSLVPSDPQFASYPSNTQANDVPTAAVLLPAAPSVPSLAVRYVLGPAGLTGASVTGATARMSQGQWIVYVDLTPSGAAAWDSLARSQFHALVAFDVDAQVYSAPIIEPTAPYFTPQGDQLQMGGVSEQQAKLVAREISTAR